MSTKSEPIFTQSDIDLFKMDFNRYNLTLQQILPVVLEHVQNKNSNMNIKTYNINRTVETLQTVKSVEDLFKYMQNKLNKYEETINARKLKGKIQEQIKG